MDTVVMTTPNGVAHGFTYRRRYRWIDYPSEPSDADIYAHDPDFVGFRAKVLVNPTGGEARHLSATLTEHFAAIAKREALTSPDAETKPTLEQLTGIQATIKLTEQAYLEVSAERVPEWDYQTEDLYGERKSVPAPGEAPGDPTANWEAFFRLPTDVMNWLLFEIRTAHVPKATPAAATSPASPIAAGPTATTSLTASSPDATPQPS